MDTAPTSACGLAMARNRRHHGMVEAEARVRLLARRLRAIVDVGMRAGYLRSALLAMEVAEVAELFLLAVHGAEARDPEHGELLQSLSLAMADDRCIELRTALRQHLLANDQPSIAALLSPTEEVEPEQAQQVPDFGAGRPLTLGERKSLARRADRDLIARVLRDPHPDVIRILLGNPGLVEGDILRLSATRPVRGEVLREVFRSAKWVVRYPVKVALALNPFTPLDIRLQLAPHLSPQDAERLLDGPRLPPTLKAVCERICGLGRVH